MATILVTQALISLAEAKEHLEIATAYTTDDNLLEGYINTATNIIELYCNRYFVKRSAANVEYHSVDGSNKIFVNFGPIDSATVYDVEDSATIASSEYHINKAQGYIEKDSGNWTDGVERYKITYTPGDCTATANVTYDVKLAAKLLVADFYRHREELTSESIGDYRYQKDKDLPFGIKGILSTWRLPR